MALLPSDADAGVWDYFATATIPDRAQVERLLAGLSAYAGGQLATVPALEAETGLRRGRVELMLKQLAVDGAVERVEGGWRPTGVEWTYDQEHYDGIIATRRREADIMRAYTRGQSCLMQLLQESLDDSSAQKCGRCSVCLGHLPEPLQERPEPATVEAVTRRLRGEVTVLEPRKMWPGGAFGSRGRIPAGLMAETGRAIVYADAPEWRELVASAFVRDGAPSQELRDAAVGALGHWRDSWPARPEVVVALPAAGYPLMTSDWLTTQHRLSPARVEPTSTCRDGSRGSARPVLVPGSGVVAGRYSRQRRAAVRRLGQGGAAPGRCFVVTVANHRGCGALATGRGVDGAAPARPSSSLT